MDLWLDRLTLRLPGLSEAEARRLVRLVGEGLATADAPGAARFTDHLHLRVAASPGESTESAAQRIAATVLQALARSS